MYQKMKFSFKIFSGILVLLSILCENSSTETDCNKLLVGQFLCPDPDNNDYIDPETQSVRGCTREGTASGKKSN